MKPMALRQINLALNSLRLLLSEVLEGKPPRSEPTGICCNWDYLLQDKYPQDYCYSRFSPFNFTYEMSAGWPQSKHPGVQISYPVPEIYTQGKWVGLNRTFRISFIRYMIKRLRDMKRRAEQREKKHGPISEED